MQHGDRRRRRHRRPRRRPGAGPRGFAVKVLEQAAEIGEIGAGVQLAPNAFAAFDALGVGERARGRAVYTERMVMMDATDASRRRRDAGRRRVPRPLRQSVRGDPSRRRAPVAARGRAGERRIELLTSTRVLRVEQDGRRRHRDRSPAAAAIAARRWSAATASSRRCGAAAASAIRCRVSGHVVYRAVVDAARLPGRPRAGTPPRVWAGPNCHLVHYPLRGGEQYNVVVTFHSARDARPGACSEGSREEVLSYFDGICDARRASCSHLPKSWKRWATADREPIARWSVRPGDAARRRRATRCCSTWRRAPAWRSRTRSTLGEALRRRRRRPRRGVRALPSARASRAPRAWC